MNSTELISVVLPVFNGEQFLLDAVQSILIQSYANIELIIIDDCSIDGTNEILNSLNDPRVILLRNSKNLGIATSLNIGILHSRGDYIARMDADDISLPHRLATQLNYLQTHNNCDLVSSSCIIFDDDGLYAKIRTKLLHDDICRLPWLGFYCPHPTWMMRSEWAKSHLYDQDASGAEDQLLLYKNYTHSNYSSISQPLLLYRISPNTPYKKIIFRRILLAKLFIKTAYHGNKYSHIPLIIVSLFARLILDVIQKIKKSSL